MTNFNTDQFSEYFKYYISKVTDGTGVSALDNQLSELKKLTEAIPENKSQMAYQEGKWTVAQLIQHCIDTERIFTYRALSFARGHQEPLGGYDENIYADHGRATGRKINDLIHEALIVRQSTLLFFKSLEPHQFEVMCNFNGNKLSVEGVAMMMTGHWKHHIEILEERYL